MYDVVFPLWIIGIPSIKARQYILAMQSTLKLAMIDSVCLSVTVRLDQTQDGGWRPFSNGMTVQRLTRQ